jgi:hypothetical protein
MLYLSEHEVLCIKIPIDITKFWTRKNFNTFKKKVEFSYIQIFSPYLTLYTLQIDHKNQSVIDRVGK